MSYIGNSPISNPPIAGADELNAFLNAVAGDTMIEVATAQTKQSTARKDLRISNGMLFLETRNGSIAVPFHAIEYVRVMP